MFLSNQNSIAVRFVMILALLSGMFGAVTVELVHAEPMIDRVASNRLTVNSSATIAPSTSLTLTVNSPLDMVDANPGDGICETTTDNGICTLRAAIQETNARSSADVINLPAGTYTLTLPGTFEDASASGDLNITDDLTIIGASSNETIIDGNGGVLQDRVIEITGAINVNISDLTIRGGDADPNNGAGIANRGGTLTLNRIVLRDNVGGHGAGLLNVGIAEIRQSIISNNIASDDAGGIRNDTTLTIIESTISNNIGRNTGGGIGNHGSLTIINSTISGNQTNNIGGGIYVGYGLVGQPNAMVDLSNVTITHNIADADNDGDGNGGGIYVVPTRTVNLQNTILAGNTGPSGSPDCYGSLTSNGYNLIESTSGCTVTGITTGNLIGVGPGLDPLQDNGGMTLTHALQSNSPALDAGDDTTCKPTDQRGITRPQGSHCDIGAYEDQSLVRFVKQDATGTGDGSSWSNAHTDLQSALAAAVPDEEIWVAAGTYKPTSGTDRTISFTLKNGVAVYGGFAGIEISRDQRDYETNVTVLSGDIGIEGDNSDNSYHVVVGSNTNNSAILDGFTITAGNANAVASFQYYVGGGMYNDKGSPRLNEVIFTDNYAGFGGGIYTFYTEGDGYTVDLILTNVVFRDNTAAREGGGMATLFAPYLSSASFRLSLTDVTFENNTAAGGTGGGMINNEGELKLVDVTFIGNTAAGGGGLSNIPYRPSTLTNVTFSNNSASDGGGGMLVGSSGPTPTTLTNVTFNNNSTAMNGGGIANAGYSDLILTNVTFSNNTAGMNGGGLSNGGILDVESGGTVNLINTTFSSNTATSNGGAIYSERGQINIYNSILYGDTGGEVFVNSGTAAVTYSIVQGGYPGIGNLDEDPLLGPLQDNGGLTQTMALGAGSPAINAGGDTNCPATDQRGVTRPQGSRCDIGAYEAELMNSAPTDINLSSSAVNENQPVGMTVGTLSTTDLDVGDSHTYAFCGGTNDASFSIAGNLLKTAAVFDYETKASYSICIRSTDSGSLSTTKTFVIGVNDLVDTQTFGDVQESYWAWNFIERLYNAGITGGCNVNPLEYCPESTVTRAQMAVFLLRGIHGSSYNPPAVGASTGFGDVELTYWAAAWIKQLAAEGITGGCGSGNYCPEAPVTRAQMAVFLLRAKYGASYNPPAVGASTGFGDVSTGYWAAAWIKQLVAEGITAGCEVNAYCPDSPVTRAQMAVFLVKTFNLP